MSYPYIHKADVVEILKSRDVQRGIFSLSHLPLPQSLAHITQGAQIVAQCIKDAKEVLVVGDYDADGICASAVMVKFFKLLGYERMRLVIPNRFIDGYGISAALLQKHAHNAAVIISVDNGISAMCAGEWCAKAHIPLVITDHHTPSKELPKASVIIDPHLPQCSFPQKDICGAVVAWYFCAALKETLQADIDMKCFFEYLAIASIGDVMPLVGINRILVQKGLQALQSAKSPLAEFLCLKYKYINAQTLAFYIAPLLNSAGRMASADIALEFLVSENLTQAHQLYAKLSSLNAERKAIQAEVLAAAKECVIEKEHFILSYGEGWHEGVLGIVAATLAKEYQKSAFVFNKHKDVLKGSGRSEGGVNLIGSITCVDSYLLHFGGHKGAVGLSLSVDKLEDFIGTLGEHFIYEARAQEPILGIIGSEEIDYELLALCEEFAPFGEGNPIPLFICEDLLIQSIKPIGKDGKHFEYVLYDRRAHIKLVGIEFFAPFMREVGQSGDVCFELSRDEFRSTLKLKIIHFTPKSSLPKSALMV